MWHSRAGIRGEPGEAGSSVTDTDRLVVWATSSHATCARHRSYGMVCEQFDRLLGRADGKCELCGATEEDSAWGQLHIDHEHQVGRWAVRGLLCDACNLRLQRGRRLPPTPRLRRYLNEAWYVQELTRLGLSADLPPEPGLGSSVVAGDRPWVRLSNEVEYGWVHPRGSRRATRTWQQLWYEYGPLTFRITEGRDCLAAWQRRLYRDDIPKAPRIARVPRKQIAQS